MSAAQNIGAIIGTALACIIAVEIKPSFVLGVALGLLCASAGIILAHMLTEGRR